VSRLLVGDGPRQSGQTPEQIRRIVSSVLSSPRTLAAWAAVGLCTAGVSVLAAPGLPGILGAGLALVMIAIAVIDARHFLIPNECVLAGLVLGLAAAAAEARSGRWVANLAGAAGRGLVVALLFLAFRTLYRRLRGRDGIGLGDVKLAAVAGVWLGWTAVSIAIDIAALSALAAVLLDMLRGRKFTAATRIPFGLFFAPAIWLAWLVDAAIVQRIFL
jgi:leader peptidase (prepilin peptidase) / N-methyltransferase